jgi:hypothetical protein
MWVYIRVEDFLVLFVLLWWGMLFVRQKVTLKTPLTIPVFLFWIIGAIATIHGMLLIFPTLPVVYANVSFLSFIRRIEYMSVFFIAYSAMKTSVTPVIVTVVTTTLLVVCMGLASTWDRLLNDERRVCQRNTAYPLVFIPYILNICRHYDLAAYYVLVVPIIASLIFDTKLAGPYDGGCVMLGTVCCL